MALSPHPQRSRSVALAEFRALGEERSFYQQLLVAERNLDESHIKSSLKNAVLQRMEEKRYESVWDLVLRYNIHFTKEETEFIANKRVQQLLDAKNSSGALEFAVAHSKNKKAIRSIGMIDYQYKLSKSKLEEAAKLWKQHKLGPQRGNIAAKQLFLAHITSARLIEQSYNVEKDFIKRSEDAIKEYKKAIEVAKQFPEAIFKRPLGVTIRRIGDFEVLKLSLESGLKSTLRKADYLPEHVRNGAD